MSEAGPPSLPLASSSQSQNDSKISPGEIAVTAPSQADKKATPRGAQKPDKGAKFVTGVANDGSKFQLPATTSPLEWLSNPFRASAFHWTWVLLSIFQFAWIFIGVPKWVFVAAFIFWRLAYNLGLGYILWKQSQDRFLTRFFQLQGKSLPQQMKQILASSMGPDYKFDNLPAEFNAWVAFRGLVEVVLALDLATYFNMAIVFFEAPEKITFVVVLSYIAGVFLMGFALWAKSDAYRVIGDFAWNWGDFFFLVEANLTFNRVFALFPHPMYTVGYSFYYGLSLITRSYVVLYVSLFAHFCQLLFLVVVEDPHIEKTYGSMVKEQSHDQQSTTILYDKRTGYFRRDLIVFKNFFVFRSSDFFTLLIFFYNAFFFSAQYSPAVYVLHAVAWRLFHSIALGYLLYLQSRDQWWTKRFTELGMTKHDAFEEWKRVFNVSLTMNYVAMTVVAVKMADFSGDLYASLLRLTIGGLLIAINVWSSVSTFEVLGEFGWFYGDFFIDEVPSRLYYTGIYRYLNNPENVTGYAGYYGLALISASFPVFALALFGQACNLIFIRYVEAPHMKKLYGDKKREKSGFTTGLNEIIQEETAELKRSASKAVDVIERLSTKAKTNLEEIVKSRRKSKDE